MFNHITHDLPKLKQVTAENGTRYYVTPEGNHYPSVTTVLKPYSEEGIKKWRKKVGEKEANRVSKRATDRGTSVHSGIEKFLLNEENAAGGMLPHAKQVYINMKTELMKMDNIHALESMLYSDKLRLAGQVDCIAEYEGVLSVVDFKTSKKLKKKSYIGNYFMQLCAYANMFTEMTGIYIEQGVIIIGVDGCNFAQVVKVNVYDHLPELVSYITKYEERVAG